MGMKSEESFSPEMPFLKHPPKPKRRQPVPSSPSEHTHLLGSQGYQCRSTTVYF